MSIYVLINRSMLTIAFIFLTFHVDICRDCAEDEMMTGLKTTGKFFRKCKEKTLTMLDIIAGTNDCQFTRLLFIRQIHASSKDTTYVFVRDLNVRKARGGMPNAAAVYIKAFFLSRALVSQIVLFGVTAVTIITTSILLMKQKRKCVELPLVFFTGT